MSLPDSFKRLKAKIKRGREKGVDRGQGSSSPASATTDQLSTPSMLTSTTPAKVTSEPAGSSNPQSPKDLSTVALSIRLADQLSIISSTSESLDLWKSAFNKFREEEPDLLSDYDQHVFGATVVNAGLASREAIETALSKLLEDREKKQWKISVLSHDIKIRAQVDRVIGILKWSDPLVKGALSTQPYAALAWSGVSLLLPLLTSSTTQNEAMLEGLSSIGELQKFWEAHEKISLRSEHRQHYQGLIEPLVNLYSLFFAYQAHVICHLSKNQPSRALQDLSHPKFWTNRLDDINKWSENCCKLIDVSREGEIQERGDSLQREVEKLRKLHEDMQESKKEHRKDEQETQLLQDLARVAGDYQRYKDLNPKRVRGTCEWLLRDERFCNWRINASSSLLWVSAGPGRGKSVLSRSLIDEELLAITTIIITPSSNKPATTTQSAVCYFFFKDGGDGLMNSAHALCTLLHQLFTCTSTTGLIKYALEKHKQHGRSLTEKASELWQILLACATAPDTGQIICVLDALDECKDDSRLEFVNTLKEFYSRSARLSAKDSKLKFLITSRPYDDLENSFKHFPEADYLRFDGDEKSEEIRKEIDLVIDARVPGITADFTTEDQQKISKHLKSMEHRTYLWLHLTLNIIEQSPSEYGRRSDIEKLLSGLPSQVSAAYEKILSRSKDQSRTKILLCILLAATQPLTLDEANVALALAIEEQEPKSHTQIELWPKASFQRIVTNLCGLFVTVYDSKLSFIHQTAREFLLDPVGEGNWKGRFTMPQSHSIISRTCLLHLLSLDIDRPPRDDPGHNQQYLYLTYAASYWPLHFVLQEVTNANAFRSHARILCHIAGPQASIWAPRYFKNIYLNRKRWTDLTLASYLGLNEVVQDILLEEGAAVDAADSDGETPLYQASWKGHVEVIKLLLEKGAAIDAADSNGETPLYQASLNRHVEVVKLLLEKGAAIDATDSDGRTPLYQASWNGHVEVVKLLLEKGAAIDAINSNGETLLYQASWKGHVEVVKLLLEKGAAIDAADSNGETPLYQASLNRHVEVVKLLLEKGAAIDATDSNGRTPLYQASWKGHVEVIKLLLEKGAAIDATDSNGRTPLYQASWNGHVEVVKLLLEKGAAIDATNSNGETPLYWASWNRHVEVVKLLLEKGAAIDATDSNGETPLYQASWNGYVEVVKLLLEKGAAIDATDSNGETPLYQASLNGYVEVVKLLLEKGAAIDAVNSNGETPLYQASLNGYVEVVKLLLEKGAAIDAADSNGETPLYQASWNGYVEVVKLLLEKGATIDAADSDGRTPLYWALWKGHVEIFKLLSSTD